MAVLPMLADDYLHWRARLNFLQLYLKQKPRLRPADRIATDPRAETLGYADTQWQVAELALALDEVETARDVFKDISRDQSLAELQPIRWLTAVTLVDGEAPGEVWRAAWASARSEALMELVCALYLVGQNDAYFEAAPAALAREVRCARLYRLGAYFREPQRDSQGRRGAQFVSASLDIFGRRREADVLLFALYSDYAARLQAQAYVSPTSVPLGRALVDWPLLLFHLAARRRAPDIRVTPRLFVSIEGVPELDLQVEQFLFETAASLDTRSPPAPDGRGPQG